MRVPRTFWSRRAIRQRLWIVVAFHLRAAVENLRVTLRDLLMESDESRIHVAFGSRLQLEVMKRIDPTHQRRAVLAGNLRNARRYVPYRKPDASIVGWIGRRTMHQAHVMQRDLARRKLDFNRFGLIDLDGDFLSAREEIVFRERITMRNLIAQMCARDELHSAV